MNTKLSTRILLVVALFVVVVGATLAVRSRSLPPEAADATASTADLSIKEVRVEEESGTARWRLIADQASVYDEEGRTALRNVTIHVMDQGRSWTVVGEEGDLYQDSRKLEIRDQVVLTDAEGLRLETSVLRWHGQERRLWTDVPVRIRQKGAVVDGTGLDVRLAREVTTVQGPVHAVFTGRSPAPTRSAAR